MSEPPAPATQSVVVQPSPPAGNGVLAAISVVGSWATAIVSIAALVAILVKMLTREVGREVRDVKRDVDDVRRTADKATSDIEGLTAARSGDIERIVRVEAAVTGIQETTRRIEANLDKNFSELAASIREVRIVAPRGAA